MVVRVVRAGCCWRGHSMIFLPTTVQTELALGALATANAKVLGAFRVLSTEMGCET
jgi:hypothetical protein